MVIPEGAEPVATVIGNVLPLPFVNVIVLPETEAVATREPVIAESEPVATVTGNVLPSPFVNVIILDAAEAVVSKDPVSVVDPPGNDMLWDVALAVK
jgi:Na+-translocating ferredoxin:NAD+ oxidoreductase RnfE subunit